MPGGRDEPVGGEPGVTAAEAEASSRRLLAAAEAGDAGTVEELLRDGADPGARTADEATPLMLAAQSGSREAVAALLCGGAVWHDIDSGGNSAGEYASGSGHAAVVRDLLDAAVRAELVLGYAARRSEDDERRAAERAESRDYLKQAVAFDEGKILDQNGEAVMMQWEEPLMKIHAGIVCTKGGDVLNVGFGMGIVDTEIQKHSPSTHTIVEAHPDVYAHAIALGWADKPGVRLVFGRWQDVVGDLGPFDGIFFDTYGEHAEDMREFHDQLRHLLKPGGIYSFFNGLCPDNLFFNLVQGELVRLQLARLSIETTYSPVPMDASGDGTWEGVKNRYWHIPIYMVPTCVKAVEEGNN